MTIFIAFLGYLAGFCAVISFIPQAIKTIRTKNTKAISLKTYITYITAQSFFLLFGILSIAIPIMHPENTSMIQIIVWGFTLILPYSATIMSASCIIFIKVQNMKKFGERANKIDILKIENNSNELREKNVI
ncbi:MAG: SemiSWEET family sugar transporter [Spiroplasma sp.]